VGREQNVCINSSVTGVVWLSHDWWGQLLGKVLLTKKAHQKSLTSKSKVYCQAQTARLAGERWHNTDSGIGVAFIEDGG
jgi:hypothetical protein